MATPSLEVQALLASATPGWNQADGLPQVVTYSFAQDGLGNWATSNGAATSWSPFSDTQKANARAALAGWSQTSGIVFVEVPDQPAGAGSDLRFRFEDLGGQAIGSTSSAPPNGDVALDLKTYAGTTLASGSLGFYALLRDIGHAIGLKNANQGSITLPANEDNRDNTVMSANPGPSGIPTHLGPFDAATAQYIYGTPVDLATEGLSGAYNLATNRVEIRTTGGPQTIRGLAYRTEIFAGDGSRSVIAGSGDTIIHTGAGNDTITGSNARTVIYAGLGNNIITAGSGKTFVYASGGTDTITGGSNDDWLNGGTGTNTIDGGLGDNTMAISTTRLAAAVIKTVTGGQVAAADGHLVTRYQGTAFGPGETDHFTNITNFAYIDGRVTTDPGDPSAQVMRLYDTAFGRAADDAGLHAWTDGLQNGLTLNAVAGSFASSAEFTARYGATTNAGFVTQLYVNTLHRGPDSAGLQAWTAALNNGSLQRSDVVVGFSESAEHQGLTAATVNAGIWDASPTATAIALLYDTAFLRHPDLAGLTAWKGASDTGTSLHDIANSFLNSAEFAAHYGSNLDTDSFVTLLYSNTLHRPPDAAGFASWTNALNQGSVDRATVMLGFSSGAEHTANSTSWIAGGILTS